MYIFKSVTSNSVHELVHNVFCITDISSEFSQSYYFVSVSTSQDIHVYIRICYSKLALIFYGLHVLICEIFLNLTAVHSIGIDDFNKTVARLGETSTLPGADPAPQTVTTEPTSLSLTRQPTNVSSLNVKSKGAATETSTMELVPSSACMPLPASRQAHCGSPRKPAEEVIVHFVITMFN